ncbi:ShlB/FhaC/HecB family hemolysin secretion/activation protein [Rhodopseudomonas palustris]|uniref:ShlB/FhaC/HecB family hemolysin secretion/activation protein n=1 Tax=Rhodopseudomonas palustris TaxID=1076 RepID=UPI0009B5CF55
MLREHRPRWVVAFGIRSGTTAGRGWQIAACCLALATCDGRSTLAAAAPAESMTGEPNRSSQATDSSAIASRPGRPAGTGSPGTSSKAAASGTTSRFDIDEYRVEGAENLPQIEVESAVYPYLGPGRTSDDVEKARAALEKAYHDKGLQTVGVSVPQQDAQRGFVVLKVVENKVGRLRVKGSRYFDLAEIKRRAPSVKEGALPNLQAVTNDIVALNRWPDRRVTPALRAGVTPGTVDVDLNVEDTYPLHGSVELNNRQSPSTTPLRLSASLRYDNLWQLGHSMTVSYQVAPQNPKDATVVSASYLARTDYDWLNILVYGLKSDSSVATVGGSNVVGPGQVIGFRDVITLPTRGELFHTLSLGADYKDFQQTLSLADGSFDSPVKYVPLVAAYSATWQGDGRLTQLNAAVTTGLRGAGSSPEQFDVKRYKATGSFAHLRGDLSHTQELPGGLQLFGKLQGQLADQPLVSSEQFSLGGQDTVRGYLESEVLGDYGVAGTLELRSPNLAPYWEQTLENPTGAPVKFNVFDEWRFFAFADAGHAKIHNPLEEQQQRFDLASYGVGTRVKTLRYLNGIVFVGIPVTSQQVTVARSPLVSFRIWGEF